MKKITFLLVALLSLTFAEKAMKIHFVTGDTTSINLSLIDSVTFYDVATTLTENTLVLYNPYAKDGFNSAFNFVDSVGVAGEVDINTGKMVYASMDSALADIAVDNSADIRPTEIVTELTSINNGFFKEATATDYDNATDLSLKELLSGTLTDNEALMFDVGSVYGMKLANDRGYVIFKVTAIDKTNTEGSTGNTGKISFVYKFTE